MSTFGVVRNRILSDLNRTSAGDLTASAEVEIQTAISYYEKERFWFLEGRATTETLVGQQFYVLPEDYRDADSLVLEVNGYTYPLRTRLYNQLESWFNSDAYRGQPTDYAIYDEQIRLYPVPDAQYLMTLSYYKKLNSLSQEDHTNAWMVEGEGLIRSRAEWALFSRKLRDYDAAQACRTLENEELAQHKKLSRVRLMTGHTRKRKM